MNTKKDDYGIIASFQKNSRETICVGLSEWKGQKQFFVRIFSPSAEGEDLIPTKSGINLNIDKFPEFLDGVKCLDGLWGEEKVAALITKSATQEVRMGSNTFKNIPLLYIRVFSQYGGSDEFQPTKQGISIKAELYPELLKAVEKLGEEIDGLGPVEQ